jgi:gamma-glutamyltranspeptidase/glutathione hydrolase
MKFKLFLSCVLSFALVSCDARTAQLAQPAAASVAARQPVRGKNGMVASVSAIASQVGVNVLKRGGNAIDAAVAVGLALAVLWPSAGNIGGGGFMVIRLADGRTTAIDYREMGPAAAHRNVYLDAQGEYIKGSSTYGHKAAGVPGAVAGMAYALEKYGTLKWADVATPAYGLARNGFTVWQQLERSLKGSEKGLSLYPETKRIFLRNGKPYEEGDVFRQPELAATLWRTIKQGPKEFYTGRTARLIEASMRKAGNGKAWMTVQDLKNYKVVERMPLKTKYRGHEIITMPPPSSGGIALIEMLNILERYDLRALGAGSAQEAHLKVEAMRRAFADRAEFLGDPDFVKVPVAGLISRAYADKLAATIDPEKASTSEAIKHGEPAAYESEETTHYTVVDKDGNVVSCTTTLNESFGNKITVEGAGFLLNNEMDDFAPKPGSPNAYNLIQGENNAVAAKKRPLSSMTPSIILSKDGKLWFAVGSPGGPTIINTVMQVILNVIDHGMNMQQAIDWPRIHHQWMPDTITYEPYGLAPDVMNILQMKSHKFVERPRYMGDAEGVMIEVGTGFRLGAHDARLAQTSVGY